MFDTTLSRLFSGTLFDKMLANQQLTLYEFNFITSLLIQHNIPYDVAFAPGTRKNAASLQLTVHVSPSATVVFVVGLEPGSSVFSPSP